MKCVVDATFVIGSRHERMGEPCQDWAGVLAVPDDRDPEAWGCVVVSDGCSTAGRTDVGARLVGLLSPRQPNTPSPAGLYQVAATLGLEQKDCYATRVAAYFKPDGLYCVRLDGDGVVALRREEDIIVTAVRWAESMPFYPAYVEFGAYEMFRDAHNEISRERGPSHRPVHVHRIVMSLDGRIIEDAMSSRQIQGADWTNPSIRIGGRARAGNVLAIASDGAEQIRQRASNSVVARSIGFEEAMTLLTDIPARGMGSIAARRMMRFVAENRVRNWEITDDLALGLVRWDNQ